MPEHTNRLIHESSPYLLQHAHNPVDWYPWGEEALAEAKKNDKLLIISIGYAACHWCHVMEHESFEDSAVAAAMNEHFVSIKVDREERPDVDDVYMTACQMSSGRACGWPLNAIALPDGRPIWAGTYFPKKQWLNILDQFVNVRQREPERLENIANQLTQGLSRFDNVVRVDEASPYTEEAMALMVKKILASVDFSKGGEQGAPKFPMPGTWEFLMRYATQRSDERAKDAVLTTLDNMARGGIYDHVGGGFARYSVDPFWHVPHFEKMLYDNGQLMSLYAKAFKLTGDERYERTIRETLKFVDREMSDTSGGFYASLDADSEGEEGKFYVWTHAEVKDAIDDSTLEALAIEYFDISEQGNWEHGKNVLRIMASEQALANKFGMSPEDFHEAIATIKSKLFDARSNRIRPGLDDKILTSWNALMLRGYVDAYLALGDDEYLDRAIINAEFIKRELQRNDGGLNRSYKDGKSDINAFLDDYATVLLAWMSLYEATFNEEWLNEASTLADYAITHFYDDSTGMFFYTSDLDPPLVARKKEMTDNVIPASNSMMAVALHRLGLFLYNKDYLEKSDQMLANMANTLETTSSPRFYANWCNVYMDQLWPLFEVAIVGDAALTKSRDLQSQYIPNAIVLGGGANSSLDLLKGKYASGTTKIFVCRDKICKYPVEDVDDALKQLR